MKILDAGTQVLDDADVLRFIKNKRQQHNAENARAEKENRAKTTRPPNFMRALRRHEEHLEYAERPFVNNENYDKDNQYLKNLFTKLEPHAKLTKTELLMITNHRPHKRELLLPMIEDIDSRFTEEQQQTIVDTVVEVLGRPKVPAVAEAEEAQVDGDANMAE